MQRTFAALWAVTYDPKFVTARHALQAIWQVGAVRAQHQALVVRHFSERFSSCSAEKHPTLIRYDLIAGLRKLYATTHADELRTTALALIATEADAKYRKKYTSLWSKP